MAEIITIKEFNDINEIENNEDIKEAKTEENQTYQAVIDTSTEIIEIEGYEYDSIDKESLTIGANSTENVININ